LGTGAVIVNRSGQQSPILGNKPNFEKCFVARLRKLAIRNHAVKRSINSCIILLEFFEALSEVLYSR